MLAELKQRGVQYLCIACMEGLKGLSEAVRATPPKTLTRLCIAHLVRACLCCVTAKGAKALVTVLERISLSTNADEAAARTLFQCHPGISLCCICETSHDTQAFAPSAALTINCASS